MNKKDNLRVIFLFLRGLNQLKKIEIDPNISNVLVTKKQYEFESKYATKMLKLPQIVVAAPQF
ncbi:hypothetical protein SL053_002339 [Flavobacterium psychrophilum]|nr:hypothetical protein [Flavobacterium psychrophilum]